MALGPRKRRIEVRPPPHLIPDLVALHAIKENAEIEILIGSSQVDAIIEFWIGVTKESTIRFCYLTIAVDIRIAKTPYAFIGLIYRPRVTGSMLRSGIRSSQIAGIVPETCDLIPVKRAQWMSRLVTDELAPEIPGGAGQEVIGALCYLGDLIIERCKGQHSRKTPVTTDILLAADRKINPIVPHGGHILIRRQPRPIGPRQRRIVKKVLNVLDIIVGRDLYRALKYAGVDPDIGIPILFPFRIRIPDLTDRKPLH